jgi:hypothetical protein
MKWFWLYLTLIATGVALSQYVAARQCREPDFRELNALSMQDGSVAEAEKLNATIQKYEAAGLDRYGLNKSVRAQQDFFYTQAGQWRDHALQLESARHQKQERHQTTAVIALLCAIGTAILFAASRSTPRWHAVPSAPGPGR